MTFQIGDRIELYAGTPDAMRADVLKVSKDGNKLYVERWGRGFQEGNLVKAWTYAKGAALIRRRG